MKVDMVAGAVVWRLPGEKVIHALETSAGEDAFMISAFDKDNKPHKIVGQEKLIQETDMAHFFESWNFSDAAHTESTSITDYMSWVETAKASMQQGRFEKVVIARRQWNGGTPELARIFSALLSHYDNALVYAFYLPSEQLIMVGASPETLLRKTGAKLYTEALGGTLTRGAFTNKEQLEHGHVCKYIEDILERMGYAYLKAGTTSRKAGMVEHLLTPFTADSLSLEEDLGLAWQLHPTSAVCGMPYKEAFNFIREIEGFDRRYYAGFLGPVKNNDFNLFVNLRCAEVYANGLVLYAGAGLNTMSDARDEWDETERKMQTVGQWA